MTKIAKNSKAPDLGLKISGTPETGQTVTIGHEAALQTNFGTKIPEMAEALLGHCLKVLMSNEASDDHPGSDERIFMLSAVEEIKPRDAMERMLAVQMAATHVAITRQGRRMANAEELPQFEAHERAYNKLARTSAAQVEALRKHRTGGKQTVTVQHVNVSEGGQAIVGNVQATGRGNDGK